MVIGKHITDLTIACIGSLHPPLSTIGHAYHSPALYWEKEKHFKTATTYCIYGFILVEIKSLSKQLLKINTKIPAKHDVIVISETTTMTVIEAKFSLLINDLPNTRFFEEKSYS